MAVTTNSSGNAGFTISFDGGPGSGVITGTATNSDNNTSELSHCRGIASGVPKPPKPDLLSPPNGESISQNPPLLDWADAPGAARYIVIIREGSISGPLAHRNKNVSGSQYTPPPLKGNTLFVWRVKPCNSAGCSKSAVSSFSTK
jgi:hypothetical protein